MQAKVSPVPAERPAVRHVFHTQMSRHNKFDSSAYRAKGPEMLPLADLPVEMTMLP